MSGVEQHSPLPWFVDNELDAWPNDEARLPVIRIAIYGADNHEIASTYTEEEDNPDNGPIASANAELITDAVNGYADALARAERAEGALRTILISIGISNNPASASNAAVVIAEQALAAADAESGGA